MSVPLDAKEFAEWRDVARVGRFELEERFYEACDEIKRLRNPGSGKLEQWPAPPGWRIGKCDPAAHPRPDGTVVCLACERLGYHHEPIPPPPNWMEAQVEQFSAIVELAVLAFIAKHGERPLLVTDDQEAAKSGGQIVALLDESLRAQDGEGLNPKLAALAAERGPEWKARYPGMEPDRCVIYMLADPNEVRVTVAERTPQLLADLAARSEIVRELLAAGRR